MRGNIGEWSELYTLLKLLADGRLYAADVNIEKIDEIYYEIIKIIRKQTDGNWSYTTGTTITIINESTGDFVHIPTSEFFRNAIKLLQDIKSNTTKSGAFELPDTWSFAQKIKCNTLKAKSSDKADITIKVHDAVVGSNQTLGFSIKSQLGGPSTLLNASSATNFIYEIIGRTLSTAEIDRFNSFKFFKDRMKYLYGLGAELQFTAVDNDIFLFNLMLVDTHLPELVSDMLLYYYIGEATTIPQLTEMLETADVLDLGSTGTKVFYSHKIKELLTNIALGMVPAKQWSGNYAATGGYIIVKEDGEVLCYHIYNRNEFREYLYNNTKLDTPSRSKHGFGNIEVSGDGTQTIKLNIQIRFIK